MTDYILPQIKKYDNIDALLTNTNNSHSIFDTGEYLSIENLLQEDFTCIVGEPGIGKSRLVEEIKNKNCTMFHFCTASEFKLESIPEDVKHCIIDALDEVEGNLFYHTLQLIKQYKEECPHVKVLFTCRKHYVASYAKHFSSCHDLIFMELCRLSDSDVMKFVNNFSETTRDNIVKSSKLRELLTIPRYLKFLMEYEGQKGGAIPTICDLFEFIIGRSIQTALNSRQNIVKNESIKILIQRVLEKVAFIMEISRKDQITKDELYSILDEVRGNMTQMLVANFDLLYFESRILKDTNGTLQFENTELQEYLAAKELCRQDNIESVLYDVAVQKELKHIYPNWYDVIPHISYTGEQVHTFINVIKLIISYESNLENNSFESLLRYIDPSILLHKQKEELFSIILEHYLRVPAYIGWKSQILKLMQMCYTPECNHLLIPPFEKLNKIQLSNIYAILEVIAEVNNLNKMVADYWTDAANSLIKDSDEEKMLVALNIYNALKDEDNLNRLSDDYSTFPQKVKEKYCVITGHRRLTSQVVVNCWLNGCYEGNPYAINAILYIEHPLTMIYAYKEIIEANKLHDFFNARGYYFVGYESYLKKQFDILWNENSESKKLITRIIASYLDNHLDTSHDEIDTIVKQILLEDETGSYFIRCFDKEWYLGSVLGHIDKKLVDFKLVSALDKVLHNAKMEDWHIDIILTTLINKIRKDEVKRTSVSEYITRYAETFDRWDKNSEEEEKRKYKDPFYIKIYNSLSDPKVPKYDKYNSAYKLSKNIDFIRHQNPQPIVDVVETFLNELDLEKMKLEKKENNTFTISMMLYMLPYFVRAIYHSNHLELLKKHRIILVKTLPIVCFTTNFDASEIKHIYKCVIGSISNNEKLELIDWWKSRKDDLINISSDSVFVCISDYGIDALSYKLEEYINDYIQQQDLSHKFAALNALELISKGYLNWDIAKYRILFNALSDDDIESVKMQCNAIMIEHYQDAEAITWRINYLKKHVLKSVNNNTGHVRVISVGEAEMTSPNPRMFRCFMNINGNEKLDNQLLDLFDFGLLLCNEFDTQEYANYLLNQIYQFFINTDNDFYISELRKRVEMFNTNKASFLVNNIKNNAEMNYLNKGKISIEKAIKQYNKCIEETHLDIRNDGDLRRYFQLIHFEVQKEIQDQGIYALVRQEILSEDFIQRELKNTIINKCCQMGLETIQIDREVALQDNKRTDLLIRYGLCNPIMVEIKLLHNKEIQIKKLRKEYKSKFIQYTHATNACLSVFWIFNVHKKCSDIAKYKDLEAEYKDLNNTKVLLTDCKCSSAMETGMFQNIQTSKQTKTNSSKTTKKRKK